jgi:CheY-like chemotaxis protein
MADMGEQWRIRVLGDLAVECGGRRVEPPNGLAGAVLVVLALRLRHGAREQDLMNWVRDGAGRAAIASESALAQHFSSLRRIRLPVPKRAKGGPYTLDWDEVRVDAAEFVAAVRKLRDLPQPPDVAKLAALIGLWRGDPRVCNPQVDPDRWKEVFTCRDRLLEVLAEADLEILRRLDGLAGFLDLFPGDRACDPVRERLRGAEPRRILVVEDQMAELIVGALESFGFSCLTVRSLDEWWRTQREREAEVKRLAGALVDLHLTPELDDRRGLEVVEWLARHTEVPASLMTMAPPPGDLVENTRVQRARYRLVGIVHKGTPNVDLSGIRLAAEALVSPDARHRRRRAETLLEWAALRADDQLLGIGGSGRNPQLERCRQDADRVRRILRDGTVEEAERQAQGFRRQYVG